MTPVSDVQKRRTLRRPSLYLQSVTRMIATPAGPAKLYCEGGAIKRLVLFVEQALSVQQTTGLDDLGLQVEQALAAYFDSPQNLSGFRLEPEGSEYCQRVWQALLAIPAGHTVTYGELARQLSSGPRAIAQACRRNPIPLFIPCHRVVAATGSGGYSGARTGPRVAFKQWLLEHEAVVDESTDGR